ncbi:MULTISPECIES: GrpB family protein [Paenibacillus]|uniref:GrpB family protein n=1 Tax=Paenibacillus TaxID=44249 RepID=UPI0021A5D13D|nr:GrpB family protein [Paenibacillus sp. p3-SID1389]MCT2194518.1 GrpB family protein [Paenibacillus sp. p3-SID1389]
MTNKVTLSNYSDLWAQEFEKDRNRILALLGDKVKRIEHVGSTSIPGMAAKPIIDIAVAVDHLSIIDDCAIALLNQIGFEYVPKEDFPNRMFFRRGEWGNGTHHLHVYEYESEEWKNIIFFRDYLIKYPDVAVKYLNLKREMAEICPDRQSYTLCKAPFIQKILAQANEEFNNTQQ